MNTSLTKFCKDTGLAKTTVYRRCQELQLDVSGGLTPAMCDCLRHEFDIPLETQAEPPMMPTVPLVPDNFVSQSTLSPTEVLDLALPEGFDPSAMVRHFDGVMGQTVNSDQVVAIAAIATSAAKKAMDDKLNQQKAALAKTEADKKTLEALISGTVVDLKVSALESRLLADRQTLATNDLQASLAQLLALGKPQAEVTSPSQPPSS